MTQSPAANTSGTLRAHLPVDEDRALDAEFRSGRCGEVAVGTHADDDEHDIGGITQRLVFRAGGEDLEPGGCTFGRGCDLLDARVARDLDVVAFELGAHERAELRVDGREHLGQLLELRDGQTCAS